MTFKLKQQSSRPITTAEKQAKCRHDFKEVGDQRDGWPSGDLQDFQCWKCGKRITVELPQ